MDTPHYATIAHLTRCVSWSGTVQGNQYEHTTYDTPERFDWSRLPADLPVVDCAAATFEQVCTALRGPVLYGREHAAAYRACGIPVRRVADFDGGK